MDNRRQALTKIGVVLGVGSLAGGSWVVLGGEDEPDNDSEPTEPDGNVTVEPENNTEPEPANNSTENESEDEPEPFDVEGFLHDVDSDLERAKDRLSRQGSNETSLTGIDPTEEIEMGLVRESLDSATDQLEDAHEDVSKTDIERREDAITFIESFGLCIQELHSLQNRLESTLNNCYDAEYSDAEDDAGRVSDALQNATGEYETLRGVPHAITQLDYLSDSEFDYCRDTADEWTNSSEHYEPVLDDFVEGMAEFGSAWVSWFDEENYPATSSASWTAVNRLESVQEDFGPEDLVDAQKALQDDFECVVEACRDAADSLNSASETDRGEDYDGIRESLSDDARRQRESCDVDIRVP